MTSRYLRLKENHPTIQKLDKIFALADELGIRIIFSDHGPAHIYDRERDSELPILSLQDIENSDYPMETFPPTMEYKVIYMNPEWIRQKEESELAEARRKAQEQKERQQREEEQRKIEAARKRLERIQELKQTMSSAQRELSILENESA